VSVHERLRRGFRVGAPVACAIYVVWGCGSDSGCQPGSERCDNGKALACNAKGTAYEPLSNCTCKLLGSVTETSCKISAVPGSDLDGGLAGKGGAAGASFGAGGAMSAAGAGASSAAGAAGNRGIAGAGPGSGGEPTSDGATTPDAGDAGAADAG
jgi:hypothetical protein